MSFCKTSRQVNVICPKIMFVFKRIYIYYDSGCLGQLAHISTNLKGIRNILLTSCKVEPYNNFKRIENMDLSLIFREIYAQSKSQKPNHRLNNPIKFNDFLKQKLKNLTKSFCLYAQDIQQNCAPLSHSLLHSLT